tara:strand:- start:345 stop:2021 length:1677 start_codon:yes stop_codon:yes gene_type:complete
MSKAQTLASTVSTGGVLADGTVAYAEVTGTPTNSATATSIAGGSAGTIPYQSAANTTAMLAVGTAGQVLQTNGAGAPTWVDAGGGSQVDFVASGTIGNGATVILNNDGTVSVIAAIEGITVGTPAVFESATSNYISATFDTNSNKVVIAYMDAGNSNYGTAAVGTVSGTSISFGTPVVYSSSVYAQFSVATFDSNSDKVVIAYYDGGNSGYGTAIVGTVSGTSITFGTKVVFDSSSTTAISITFDSTNNKVVIVYSDGNNGTSGTAIVGTVSGTAISFGTSAVFNQNTDKTVVTFDSNSNKVVIAFRDVTGSYYLAAIVGTVSGTSISFGSKVVFETSAFSDSLSTVFDSTNNKIVIAYSDAGNSNYGTAIVGTVSGTSISFGTPVVFDNSGATSYTAVTHDTYSGKTVVFYRDGGNSGHGTAIVGTVSGTGATGTISFTSPTVFESANTNYIAATFDTANNTTVIAYKDSGNSSYGTAITFATKSSNFASFIGISDAAISDTATGSVTIKGGVSTNVTSLTPATDYYVQADGSISATVSAVPAGKALSATSILLKGI